MFSMYIMPTFWPSSLFYYWFSQSELFFEILLLPAWWLGYFWFCWRFSCAVRHLPGDCLVKGRVVFCWSRPLRGHMMSRKSLSITQQTVDGALALVCLATLCWPSLGFPNAGLRWWWPWNWFALSSSCCFHRLRVGGVSPFLLDRTAVADLWVVLMSGPICHCW